MQVLRSALVSSLRSPIRQSKLSLVGRALAILRSYGTNAHVYLPGSEQVSYGPELVTNGTFDTATGWTVPAGWSVGSGVATASATSSSLLCGQFTPSTSKTYVVEFDWTHGGGTLYVAVGLGTAQTITTSGHKRFELTCGATTARAVEFYGGAVSGSIDNISVREVTYATSTVSGLPTNNYTLSNGSTGHSTVDGTAGLVLDGAGATVQYNPATVPTGSYEGTGASTVVRTGANLTFTSAPSGDGIRLTPIYGASDTFSFVKFTASGSGSLVVYAGGSPATFTLTGTPTQYQCGTAGNASDWLIFRSNSAGMSASITINEIGGSSGIHATQATTANKPALRRGLYNLLTYSNDLSNAAWVAEFTASKSGSNILTPAVGDDVYHASTVSAGTYSLAAQLSGSGTCSLFAYNATNGIHGVTQITLTSTPTIFVSGITSTVANTAYYIGRRTGDTATSITFGGAGLFAGTLTAAQILAEGGIPLTTSTAASNSGAGRYSWQFGDTSKYMLLGAPVAQMSDDSWCIAAVNASASASDKYIANLAGGAGLQNVSSICVKGTTGYAQAAWIDDGGAHILSVADAINHVGSMTVISAVKRGTTGFLRVNGVQAGSTSLAVIGTTTVTNGVIGGYDVAHSSNQFIGTTGAFVMGKGTVSDADLLTLERWVASLTPAAPTF